MDVVVNTFQCHFAAPLKGLADYFKKKKLKEYVILLYTPPPPPLPLPLPLPSLLFLRLSLQRRGLNAITRSQRVAVLAYLTSESETCEYIDESAPPATVLDAGAAAAAAAAAAAEDSGAAAAADGDGTTAGGKRPAVEDGAADAESAKRVRVEGGEAAAAPANTGAAAPIASQLGADKVEELRKKRLARASASQAEQNRPEPAEDLLAATAASTMPASEIIRYSAFVFVLSAHPTVVLSILYNLFNLFAPSLRWRGRLLVYVKEIEGISRYTTKS